MENGINKFCQYVIGPASRYPRHGAKEIAQSIDVSGLIDVIEIEMANFSGSGNDKLFNKDERDRLHNVIMNYFRFPTN